MNITIVIGVAVLLAVAVIGLLTHAIVAGSSSATEVRPQRPSKSFPPASTGADNFKGRNEPGR